jgi:DEAD/DEAH box helicase domain-containing protein
MESRVDEGEKAKDPSPLPPVVPSSADSPDDNDLRLIRALRLVDPVLVFLTKSTGQISVPLRLLRRALPPGVFDKQDNDGIGPQQLLKHLCVLAGLGVLHVHAPSSSSKLMNHPSGASTSINDGKDDEGGDQDEWDWNNAELRLGFPLQGVAPPHRSMHGSTKTGAQRRLAALRRILTQKKQEAAASKKEEPSKMHGYTPQERADDDATNNDDRDDEKPEAAVTATTTPTDVRLSTPIARSSPGVSSREACDVHGDTEAVTTTAVASEEEQSAYDALSYLLGFEVGLYRGFESVTGSHKDPGHDDDGDGLLSRILPRQVSYAGSHPAQPPVHGSLPPSILQMIPNPILRAFGLLDSSTSSVEHRKMYRHQADAVTAALEGKHCITCTGTGSGKSLCFWLPVLSSAYSYNRVSLVVFPTKALAQDQLGQLLGRLHLREEDDPERLPDRIRPAALDGDTPHSDRIRVASWANVILTNPDALHAALLPNWQTTTYRSLWERLDWVVLDECHVYEGTFGAHVKMILSRLARVRAAAVHQSSSSPGALRRAGSLPSTGVPPGLTSSPSPPSRLIFLAASATVPWPEEHFRRLFPIANDEAIAVLGPEKDGSPRVAKHFLVWNPPLLRPDGSSSGRVVVSKSSGASHTQSLAATASAPHVAVKGYRDVRQQVSKRRRLGTTLSTPEGRCNRAMLLSGDDFGGVSAVLVQDAWHSHHLIRRRHAAEETALLLAKAVANGVRCMAFCKTRNLVEWVFERAQAALRRAAPERVSQIESYRGGYTREERRKIEQRLFRSELLGVVGTNALELGVNIGGIDLTLHCGYPSSYASLVQQAGRGGRGVASSSVPSCAVIICFGSPLEQQLWKNPKCILEKGAVTKHAIPVTSGLVECHLLCASEEFPLTGIKPVSIVFSQGCSLVPSDHDLFGGEQMYEEALKELLQSSRQDLSLERIGLPSSNEQLTVYRARPSLRKPWSRVSIRSIEPVNYALIDLLHPGQAGKQDGIYDEKAILDTIPYSRIFYHAHPGAVVTHRGRKLKVVSMTRPPPFGPEHFTFRRGLHLASYAVPTNVKYATRPLSTLLITVTKTLERVDLGANCNTLVVPGTEQENIATATSERWAFAGCGAVNVKRSVHGYKKISLISGVELERSELSLPPMEYETFGIWFDTEASVMAPALGEAYGSGVHALSHALLAVAPLFVPGVARSDLECDHSYYDPTRITLFDERAGGSGVCKQLWSCFFRPDSLMNAAIDLLDECSSCSSDEGYDSGCPACLHASNCMKFNTHLSRSAGAKIGRRLLSRIQETEQYRQNEGSTKEGERCVQKLTPRRDARRKAVNSAKELHGARERQFVVGRVSWPLDAC